MSGHSKWSTIKRAKGVKDAARGKLFSKISRAISIAAKNGTDIASNARLRVAVDAARAVNMPKENVERAIQKGAKSDVQLEEVAYEGFGPEGIGIIVEAATDNRNRTSAEIKSIFTKYGGNMAGPGSVSFNFDPKGFLLVKKTQDVDMQMLTIIDLGVEEVEDTGENLEVYVMPSDIAKVKESIESAGFEVLEFELVKKPKSLVTIESADAAKRAMNLLEFLEDLEDVQKVYTNADIDEDLVN